MVHMGGLCKSGVILSLQLHTEPLKYNPVTMIVPASGH